MSRNGLHTSLLALALAALCIVGAKLSPSLRGTSDETLALSPCDPGTGACTVQLPAGGLLEFSLAPRPVKALAVLKLSARISGLQASQVYVDLDGAEMEMGNQRALLTGTDGEFAGETMLPVCVSGTMPWLATVTVQTASRTLAVPFRFTVAGP